MIYTDKRKYNHVVFTTNEGRPNRLHMASLKFHEAKIGRWPDCHEYNSEGYTLSKYGLVKKNPNGGFQITNRGEGFLNDLQWKGRGVTLPIIDSLRDHYIGMYEDGLLTKEYVDKCLKKLDD
jgi:hypothetical protein